MPQKHFDWAVGVRIPEHTKEKHLVLQDYFREYLTTRCQLPKQEKFRLVVVDAFCGGGLYEGGELGSPLLFLDELDQSAKNINTHRISQGFKPLKIECLLVLNDADQIAIETLKKNATPFTVKVEENPNLSVEVLYLNRDFEQDYLKIKELVQRARCSNVFFCLDQYGYSKATPAVVRDIISSWKSSEVLLTFTFSSLLTYYSSANSSSLPISNELRIQFEHLSDSSNLSRNEWLGRAEKIVFEELKGCAPFVSPFSINNPNGWRYWLMHFASSYRGRQVYNDILHSHQSTQVHFGRSGLRMLSYDPSNEGQLYLFDSDSRKNASDSLHSDIPKLIAESGDSLGVQEFYQLAYSETPAHSDDIHKVMMESPDIQIITDNGGERRSANQIKSTDIIRLNNQKSFSFAFLKQPKDQRKGTV